MNHGPICNQIRTTIMSLSLPALYGPILSAAQKCAELPTIEDETQVR